MSEPTGSTEFFSQSAFALGRFDFETLMEAVMAAGADLSVFSTWFRDAMSEGRVIELPRSPSGERQYRLVDFAAHPSGWL